MTICKFWQQGNCKKGDNCRFEHPQQNNQRQRDAPRNPFAPLLQNQGGFGGQQQQGSRYEQNRQGGGRQNPPQQRFDTRNLPYHLDPRTIRDDLTNDLPLWPLSAYGPGRDAPKQLIEGESEQSADEMRALFYLARLQGNTNAAMENESARAAKAQAQIKSILSDLDGACKYIIDGKNQHPNRLDICNQASGSANSAGQMGSQRGAAPFGAKPPNPFASGANQSTESPFSRPPQPTNPFGQARGQPASNPFNQPAPASTPGFGQPSVPGQTSTFGRPSLPGSQPAFGGQPAPGQQTAFGQPSTLQANNPFGQPAPFGQPNTLGTSPAGNPFGQKPQTNGSGASPVQSSPFGQPPAQANPFSQAPPANPFSSAKPMNSNAFLSQPAPPTTSQGFPGPSPNPPATSSNAPFAKTGTAGGFPPPRPRGAPRFFDNPPEKNVDTEAPPEDYGPEGSQGRRALEEAYRIARTTGQFEGDVPDIPPLYEWRGYDF